MGLPLPLVVTALLLIGGIAEATVRKTALSVEMVSLGRFIQLYEEQQGSYPNSWSEFEKVTPGLDKTFPLLTPTMRMKLISPPFDLARGHNAEGIAVAMTRDSYRLESWRQTPITGTSRKILREPVYGVIVMHNGGVFRREIPPDAMYSILQREGLSIPEPSGLGAFGYERGYFVQRYLKWAAIVAFFSWLVWRLFRKCKNALKKPQ